MNIEYTPTTHPNPIKISKVDDQWVGQMWDDLSEEWSAMIPLPFTPEASIDLVIGSYTARGMTVLVGTLS